MRKILTGVLAVGLFLLASYSAEALEIHPKVAFTSIKSKLLYGPGYEYVIGGVDSGGLFVQKATTGNLPMEDRTNLEFNLSGQVKSDVPVYLNFYLSKTITPGTASIFLYSYSADGVANAQEDFFRTDSFIKSFDNIGVSQPDPYFNAFSIDVTDIYNQYVLNHVQHLGFIFILNDEDYYQISNGDNKLYNDISLSTNTLPPLPNGWGDHINPNARAGEDLFAPANTNVVLDGSASTASNGTITSYRWTRLPDYVVLCSKSEPKCLIQTTGRAEEVIELRVIDNNENTGRDTVSILNGPQAVCGNGKIEAPEVCDGNSISCLTPQGYSGTMYCQVSCTFGSCISGAFCGDHIKNGNEVCDGNTQVCTTVSGYTGTMACNGQCTAFGSCTTNLSCGDGICSAPPETTANCPQDCTAPFSLTLEAENMPTKTTGGAVSGGWEIWANGYIQQSANFPTTGTYNFQVTARGDAASGVWPIMEIRIDQVVKATINVTSTNWSTYNALISVPSGSHNVAIAFTNDVYAPPADRNLYVDKVSITK